MKTEKNLVEVLPGMPSPPSWKLISMTSERRPPTSTRRTPWQSSASSAGHRVKRIHREVPEHLFQLILIDLRDQCRGRHAGDDRDPRSRLRFMLDQIQRIGKDFVQILFGNMQRGRPGILQKLP